MTSSLDRQPDGSFIITLTFPWSDIVSSYNHIVSQAVDTTELPGFRKGKAPRNLVEPKLNRTDTFSQALQAILPQSYQQAVTTHNLKPILYPKLHITKAQEDQDWIVTATSCEAPVVTLPDYTTELSKQHVTDTDHKLNHILDYLSKSATVNLPAILVEEETNHRLTSLADNLTALGMTTQAYLDSKKLTLDTLKSQYSSQAKTDLALEFILASIQTAQSLPDRQKTLDFLTSLI